MRDWAWVIWLGVACGPSEPDGPADGEGAATLQAAWSEISKEDHPELDDAFVESEIARLSARYDELRANGGAAAAVDGMRTLLFDEGGFRSVDALETGRTLHIDSVLRDRRGYCLSLSALALVVAERSGVPWHGVAAPNHFFVRYDDGETRENLELTRRGAVIEPEKARALLGDFVDEREIYLRNLTPEEVANLLLHNRGYVALVERRHVAAERDLRAVIRRMPGLPEAHRNLGVLLGEQARWEDALSAFEEALRLYPGDVDALLNRAICHRSTGNLDRAIEDLRLVQAIRPGHARAAELLAEWEHVASHGVMRREGLKPGLRATYFKDSRLSRSVLTRIDREIDFDWQNGSPGRGVPRDGFAARWEGFLRVETAGLHTFFVVANDGARLWVDDQLVADNWKDMGYENWYGTADVELGPGDHALKIEYFDRRGGARIMLRIGVEGVEKPLDPKRVLFHRPGD